MTKPLLPSKLPHAVVGLLWALTALYLRTGKGGATHSGLKRMLGTSCSETVRRLVNDAKRRRVVVVRYTASGRPLVMLKTTTLRELEATWETD